MDFPRPIFHSFYDKLIHTICNTTQAVCKNSMRKAAQEETEKCIESGQTNGITVSGDGSWRKRGFSSLFGLVTLIGWFTGKVLDIVVKSKYCKSCEFWEKKFDTEERVCKVVGNIYKRMSKKSRRLSGENGGRCCY